MFAKKKTQELSLWQVICITLVKKKKKLWSIDRNDIKLFYEFYCAVKRRTQAVKKTFA